MRPTLSRLSATLAVIAAFGSASCRDLSETPFTEVTQANFNPTAADLAALLAPAYTPMRTIYMSWYGMVDFQEETADELLTPVRPNGWYDGGVYQRLHEHRWDANQGQPNGLYGNLYSGINAANRVIFQIESGVIPCRRRHEGECDRRVAGHPRALLLGVARQFRQRADRDGLHIHRAARAVDAPAGVRLRRQRVH
jgi:hypothetical protein